jgi:membrane-associated protein
LSGYFFGNIGFIKDNFSIVIIGVMVISLIPVLAELWRNHRKNRNHKKSLPSLQ